VRKISFGVGVERTFPLHSPSIARLELVQRGRVRRAKLYYLRDLRGKKARIRERRVDDAKLAAMEEAAAGAAEAETEGSESEGSESEGSESEGSEFEASETGAAEEAAGAVDEVEGADPDGGVAATEDAAEEQAEA